MTRPPGVEAILERLIAQFASPYDFLRELVQNAMDAGSDRVEVTLEMHPVDGDHVVFELIVADTGAGMDESIIDGELTRLFATSKADDRTMAGGFGIGFVSVFAWDPEVVLLQTGRAGESWELVFFADRSFEKTAVADPVEGTTLRLFRRGIAAQRDAIAEAVRDALWRWTRFCPLEITFEDVDSGDPPELIVDSPTEHQGGDADLLVAVHERGDTTVRVAFGVPAEVVFLRRGLVLAEGSPGWMLADVGKTLGRSGEHLRVWADSPFLRTTLARDKVVEDEGRDAVEGQIAALVEQLRGDLVARLEALVADGTPWTPRRHELYASLHAHMAIELGHLGASIRTPKILRDVSRRRAWSLASLVEHDRWRIVCTSSPRPTDAEERPDDLLRLAGHADVPVLAANLPQDEVWLRPLVDPIGFALLPLCDAVSRVEPEGDDGVALAELVERILQTAGLPGCDVGLARFVDAGPAQPLLGIGAQGGLAIYGGPLPLAGVAAPKLWLNREHALTLAAIRVHAASPVLAAMSVALAIAGRVSADGPQPRALARAVDQLRPP